MLENIERIIYLVLEEVSTRDFQKKVALTKEVEWWSHFPISAEVSNNKFWSLQYSLVTRQGR